MFPDDSSKYRLLDYHLLFVRQHGFSIGGYFKLRRTHHGATCVLDLETTVANIVSNTAGVKGVLPYLVLFIQIFYEGVFVLSVNSFTTSFTVLPSARPFSFAAASRITFGNSVVPSAVMMPATSVLISSRESCWGR